MNFQELWIGFGCQSGISHHLITAAIKQVLQDNQLEIANISGIATIDTKASEAGLLTFCCLFDLPLKTFPAQILAAVAVPNPSTVITQQVGTPSVAEAAAIVAAANGEADISGVQLLVPKTIFHLPGEPGVVTIAIAQSSSVSKSS